MRDQIQALVEREYQYGFTTDLDTDVVPKGGATSSDFPTASD